MSKVVIKVENISKQYRLGTVSTGTIGHDINRWWHKVRGKEDPYLKIGDINDRTQKAASDYVWALKNINFEVRHGEVLGIIGRNGAGKSTLLKILSRTTSPTTGSVKIKGRIASLLEVGTGFHPELSGRENIFLNGAILGMTKQDIKRRFDEIVGFAGVERYIDTPVKRYSSGMYVRLAFGVAAHLEPDILIVDEVLAVGDAEFQKKALGKMKDVSTKEGRTVLFVSHNISAIKNFCSRCFLMDKGTIASQGSTQYIINKYFETNFINQHEYIHKEGTFKMMVSNILMNDSKSCVCKIFEELEFKITYEINEPPVSHVEFFILLSNEEGDFVSGFFEADTNIYTENRCLSGVKTLKTKCNLSPGRYYVSAGIFDHKRHFIDWVEYAETFIVEEFYEDNRIFKNRLGYTVGAGEWRNV